MKKEQVKKSLTVAAEQAKVGKKTAAKPEPVKLVLADLKVKGLEGEALKARIVELVDKDGLAKGDIARAMGLRYQKVRRLYLRGKGIKRVRKVKPGTVASPVAAPAAPVAPKPAAKKPVVKKPPVAKKPAAEKPVKKAVLKKGEGVPF